MNRIVLVVMLLFALMSVVTLRAADVPAADVTAVVDDKAKPKPEPDRRITQALEDRNIKFAVDEDGDVQVLFEITKERSQIGIIRSVTSKYRNLEIREILSVAYRSPTDDFPSDVANALLANSHENKIGGWTKNARFAVYVTKLPAGADSDSFITSLRATLAIADRMEQKLTDGKDEF